MPNEHKPTAWSRIEAEIRAKYADDREMMRLLLLHAEFRWCAQEGKRVKNDDVELCNAAAAERVHEIIHELVAERKGL